MAGWLQRLSALLPVAALLLAGAVAAQPGYSTLSKRAIQHYEAAGVYYSQWRGYRKKELLKRALEELNKAVETDSLFAEAHAMLGDIFFETQDWENGVAAYRRLLRVKPDFFPPAWLSLGKAEMAIGRYDEARFRFEKYLTYERQPPPMIREAQRMLRSCAFAVQAMKNPVPFEPVNMGPNVNSEFDEYSPSFTIDGQKLIITLRKSRPMYDEAGTVVRTEWDEDFYVSEWKDGAWSKARNLGPPINTWQNEGAQCLSADGQYLFYTACNRKGGMGSCDIYGARRKGGVWDNPVNMGLTVNSEKWESHPSFASDGKTLYFTSTRRGGAGEGTSDIWFARIEADGKWSGPHNMGPVINTEVNESFPFMHPDGRTLYFVSDGHPGMGGRDIFMTRRDANGEWSTPVNLGYPINTFADESSFIVNAAGTIAYFASERPGEGQGGIDLYYFPLYEGVRPDPVTYVRGSVFNAKTKAPLGATFELIDLDSGATVIESFSDAEDGQFLVCLPSDRNYALNVSKEGFLFYSENFSLKEAPGNEPFKMDVPLQPIEEGGTVVLRNVFFETASYALREESQSELMRLVNLLNKQPAMRIEVSGHTDNVGEKSYNQILSENRASSVLAFLAAKGIAADRLTFKGYGDTRPIDTNATEAGRQRNRRTEFRVVAL